MKFLTIAPVPVDALKLNEDINALEKAKELLNSVDPANVSENPEDGYKVLRMAKSHIGACYRYAWDKMRREYLDPRRKPVKSFERKTPHKV